MSTATLNPDALGDLYEAVQTCLDAERERQKNLKPNSPASTYTTARIAKLVAALTKARNVL